MKVKAILTKPLDGDPEGTEREFEQGDFDQLKRMGAVRAANEEAPAAIPAASVPTAKQARPRR